MRVDSEKSFGTRECPSCATEVPANENRCPICSYEFPNTNPRQRGMKLWGAILMLLLLLALVLAAYL
ncbi:MAG: hypothetical protein M5U15_03175 [Kiritimatiellae bacterium]|nr:hypothetical protein [Kiritimatiellia bacterium]